MVASYDLKSAVTHAVPFDHAEHTAPPLDQGVSTVVAEIVRRLTARFPWLPSTLGDRLEFELPAFMVSLAIHGMLLVGLAFAGYQVHHEALQREIHSEVVDSLISSDVPFQNIDQSSSPPTMAPVAGSFSPTLANTITSAPISSASVPVSIQEGTRGSLPQLATLDVKRATEIVIPTATMLGQTVSIKGSGAEMVGGVEGAVDRIAVEILRRMEQGRTLVVWAFDASGSLQAERERLSKHIDTIYNHITQLDESQLAADSGLITMVVAFGNDRRALLAKPTSDRSEILEAIGKVPLDETGVETTFGTVAEIVTKWGRYKDKANRLYHTMIIVVTDEVGDDEDRLEDAIGLAKKSKVPVYVLGNQAIFGRLEGYVNYTDPKTKQVFYHVPVRQGPESIMLEQIRLPFWYGGPQYEIVEAGFGPYALSRLASETGGIYFVTRFDTKRMGFDLARIREYKPELIRRDEYEKQIRNSPLRQAILNAAIVTQQNLPGMPAMVFPPVDTPEFKEQMTVNQGIAERTAYTVDEALGPITAAAKYRDREVSRRWQAHFDLIRGRLLAMKVRCKEYNAICARMKQDPQRFKDPKSNAWKLVPDKTIQFSDNAKAASAEAQKLLERVVHDHPTTPWALLAQRELEHPLGFKWAETYVPPPRRGNDNDVAAQKKKKQAPSMNKPQEVPKL